jgi:hypothetical protein
VLPDILRYNRAQPAAYPNGRALTNDVFSARLAFLTNGKVSSDGLKPHGDLLADFPFPGPPKSLTGWTLVNAQRHGARVSSSMLCPSGSWK